MIKKSKLRVGDEVQVISGKEKGRRGKLISIDTKNERVRVEGLNKILKNIKPRQKGESGTQSRREGTIHISNVMVFDTQSSKPTRVGMKKERDQWVRVAKKSGAPLPSFGKAESRARKSQLSPSEGGLARG